MSERITITIHNTQQGRQELLNAWNWAKLQLLQGVFVVMTMAPETRSQAQNRLMWPLLTCFRKALLWPINGRMVDMDEDDWKDVLSAAFKGDKVRLAMGLDGGVVLLGQRTSKFTKKEFSEWIEFLYATAADRGVKLPLWVEPE